jgi:hypothetical protein
MIKAFECYNLESERSGEKVKNQMVMRLGRFVIFNSYGCNIALYDGKKNICYKNLKYDKFSRTTTKYYNQFIKNEIFCKDFITLVEDDFNEILSKIIDSIWGCE